MKKRFGKPRRTEARTTTLAPESQQIVSDDDEIDFFLEPEFYDPELDDKDELWVRKKRKGPNSDAVLTCPACFTTLCLDCQRHEKYLTQYRAMFVVNCKIIPDQASQPGSKRKRGRQQRKSAEAAEESSTGEILKPVQCAVCSTQVGVFDEQVVYHFFNTLPSKS